MTTTKYLSDFVVGDRLLIRKLWGSGVTEVTLLEISPSGRWYKVQWSNAPSWKTNDDWIVEEKLETEAK